MKEGIAEFLYLLVFQAGSFIFLFFLVCGPVLRGNKCLNVGFSAILVANFFVSFSLLVEIKGQVNDVQRFCHLCNECEEAFPSKECLNTHIEVHMRDKSHKCNKCGEVFPSEKCLNTHKEVHVRDKSDKCIKCEEAFSSKECLNTHKEIHMRDKSHKCNKCEGVP